MTLLARNVPHMARAPFAGRERKHVAMRDCVQGAQLRPHLALPNAFVLVLANRGVPPHKRPVALYQPPRFLISEPPITCASTHSCTGSTCSDNYPPPLLHAAHTHGLRPPQRESQHSSLQRAMHITTLVRADTIFTRSSRNRCALYETPAHRVSSPLSFHTHRQPPIPLRPPVAAPQIAPNEMHTQRHAHMRHLSPRAANHLELSAGEVAD